MFHFTGYSGSGCKNQGGEQAEQKNGPLIFDDTK
jgi:hypothetical protein